MKTTCGTDMIEIERIQQSIEHLGQKFLKKIYTENEITYCESKKTQKYQHYAARFAAKEATFKALSEIINDIDGYWQFFETVNDNMGKPHMHIHYPIKGIKNIEMSISHCKAYAIAMVIVTYEEQ